MLTATSPIITIDWPHDLHKCRCSQSCFTVFFCPFNDQNQPSWNQNNICSYWRWTKNRQFKYTSISSAMHCSFSSAIFQNQRTCNSFPHKYLPSVIYKCTLSSAEPCGNQEWCASFAIPDYMKGSTVLKHFEFGNVFTKFEGTLHRSTYLNTLHKSFVGLIIRMTFADGNDLIQINQKNLSTFRITKLSTTLKHRIISHGTGFRDLHKFRSDHYESTKKHLPFPYKGEKTRSASCV